MMPFRGPWGALSPVPENNAITIEYQGRSLYVVVGDSCAYCWDVETGQIKTAFKGHSDYLHCVVARNSRNQVFKLIQISINTQSHSKALKGCKHPGNETSETLLYGCFISLFVHWLSLPVI
ncbi:hypothetical protein GIB67_003246 [Kingdonia uniflora]|uniref:Uncharacterized protein n=1 Tax=Kingdonia uniflora TaxID=39325 RepID=A0A7J7LXT6_9MAGN|nr:hypothetical protein GIB67_003246 [Kingdonia uniflora]